MRSTAYYNSRGVTLLEILITIIVSIILVGAIFLSFVIGLKKWEEENITSILTRDALFALDKMTREIRQAVNIQEAKERKIAIDVDINPLDEHTQPERVIYSLDSSDETILYRKISSSNPLEGKRVLCRNVKSFHLFYRDDNNNVLTYPPPVNLIRVVEINLVLEKERREISLTSSAQLRNIGE